MKRLSTSLQTTALSTATARGYSCSGPAWKQTTVFAHELACRAVPCRGVIGGGYFVTQQVIHGLCRTQQIGLWGCLGDCHSAPGAPPPLLQVLSTLTTFNTSPACPSRMSCCFVASWPIMHNLSFGIVTMRIQYFLQCRYSNMGLRQFKEDPQ